jgi:predicted CxxxxCH...CXXCH cytochrome family protein
MTKKEREYLEFIETKLALHQTEPVSPDLPPPERCDVLAKGWSFNMHTGNVYKTCSSVICHGVGWDNTNSRGPLWQYSTEVLALRALRYALENECAKKLRQIDLLCAALCSE